ncbi:MAG TPA: lytic transglycosylase domain-containing protein [Burkholderiales bacterium]|nr:lytic transglycosylase domain-containing protein [Burkholderiales bacterium]
MRPARVVLAAVLCLASFGAAANDAAPNDALADTRRSPAARGYLAREALLVESWHRARPGTAPPAEPTYPRAWGAPNAAATAALAARPYHKEILKAAREAGIDPVLVHAVIRVESAYNARAVSKAGALGLMQVIPGTGRRFGVDNLLQPSANITAGTLYLSYLMRVFEGDVRLALAAYNAGENAVLRHGRRIPPYRETRGYVPRVLDTYRVLSAIAPDAQPPK